MKAYRIGSAAFPVFDGSGAAAFPGRWNALNQRAIYCGESFAIAMLERLCYATLGRLPAGDLFVAADIPDDLVEVFDPALHPGWDEPGSPVARDFGARWFRERRTLALSVPSAVTRIDRNVVINQDHPSFAAVRVGPETRVVWDQRLFGR